MSILKTINLLGLIAVLAFEPFLPQQATAQPGISVPVQTFYNELAPYGQWVPSPAYGSVWIPNVGQDFQPYATDGHWIVTEFGNTWVSDYPWGWAPFHYGRWYFDNQYGWAWVPGSDWGPAWVSWRSGGGYYGWAPLGPGFDINVNINIPAPYWTFVPQVYITSPYLYSYRVARPNVVNIYQNTTIINNIYRSNNRAYVYGPNRGEIERITRRSVPVYRIDPLDRPGRSVVGNGSVGFYRPGGQPSGYGQNYGRNDRYDRNDRFDNSPRPNYNNNNGSSRGTYGGNNSYNGNNTTSGRDYNGNNAPSRPDYGNNNGNNSAPSRDYNGGSSRGSYNNSAPADRSGSLSSPVPTVASPNPTPSNRFEPSRGMPSSGNFQPGGNSRGEAQPGGFQQQPNRTFDRADRPGSIGNSGSPSMPSAPSAPAGRSDGGNFQRMQENRGGQNQFQPHGQEQPQRGNGGGERQRGPR
ncbi:DUF6600 domain-containing protein [Spirosoma radiotolerans]|uniref:Prolyl-tRNA synthetase n=1 Tax=Spirosoma radiotolerans TaxID=1379870 RepID=A0A0E3V8W9_9BACT|nr:DUF6600 domain-containing protein [Spirosoma radiotolerans]AKD56636.1 hypothetical protein SD10_18765 [Spirosoma radiotolerans]